MYKKTIIVLILLIFIPFFLSLFKAESGQNRSTWWRFQSIDTMKYSRDLSREKLNDSSFDSVIDMQVKNIADTGATHVAIATPYDEEFYPILQRWVAAARKYNLNVWFRGNWSGWEGWFNYPKISRQEHIKKTQEFIAKHKEIFTDGDVFTACPECENGGPGDPRQTDDIQGHRKFLIDEYNATKTSFAAIGKNVASNFDSMNGDVARVVMDRNTTSALDGMVVIDHYVATPEKLASDVASIARASGGKIVLGEFGAPIPDINGNLTEDEQASWIKDALLKLLNLNGIEGVSYWTNTGSSTALWDENGSPRKAAGVIKTVFKASFAHGVIKDEAGGGIEGAYISIGDRHFFTDSNGEYALPYFENYKKGKIYAPGFINKTVEINTSGKQIITLMLENEGLWFRIRKFLYNLLNFLP